MVTAQDVRAVALSLPRTEEHLIRDHIKFRVGKIVYVAISPDETNMGFGFPKEERAAMIAAEPGAVLPERASDARFNWIGLAWRWSARTRCASSSPTPGAWWCPSASAAGPRRRPGRAGHDGLIAELEAPPPTAGGPRRRPRSATGGCARPEASPAGRTARSRSATRACRSTRRSTRSVAGMRARGLPADGGDRVPGGEPQASDVDMFWPNAAGPSSRCDRDDRRPGRGGRRRRATRPDTTAVDLDAEPDTGWLALYRPRGQKPPPIFRRLLHVGPMAVVRLGPRGGTDARDRPGARRRGWAGLTAVEVDPRHRRRGLGRRRHRRPVAARRRAAARPAFTCRSRRQHRRPHPVPPAGFADHHEYHYRVAPPGPDRPLQARETRSGAAPRCCLPRSASSARGQGSRRPAAAAGPRSATGAWPAGRTAAASHPGRPARSAR